MNWTSFPWGAAITFLTLFAGLLMAAVELRFGKTFAKKHEICTGDGRWRFLTREDATGMSQRIDHEIAELNRKIERNAGLFVSLDDRTGDLEQATSLISERQSHQWDRLSDQMARTSATLQMVTEEQKEIGKMLQDLALRLERLQRNPGGTS